MQTCCVLQVLGLTSIEHERWLLLREHFNVAVGLLLEFTSTFQVNPLGLGLSFLTTLLQFEVHKLVLEWLLVLVVGKLFFVTVKIFNPDVCVRVIFVA